MIRTVFILMLLLIGCKTDKTKVFLQQNQISLVAPRVTASNMIIDSTIVLTADFMMDDIQIVYTKDGSEPTKNSSSYVKPILVSEPHTYKFKAFHEAWNPSEVAEINLVRKGFNVDSIIWLNNFNEKYLGQGARTLINHTKATNNFMNDQWQGFEAPVSLICLFNEKVHVSSIDIGYLNNPGAWILPPQRVIVYSSTNGIDFLEISSQDLGEPEEIRDVKIETLSIPLHKEIKYLKIDIENISNIPDWHEGKGNKAWLFMDEIIFNK